MRRRSSSSSLKYLAVTAADTAAMSSRFPYRPRGGRNETHGRGAPMTKDGNHFFQQGGRGGISSQLEYQAVPANRMPHFNQYQSFNRPTLSSSRPFYSHPHPHANQNHNLSMQPHLEQNHPIYPHPYRSQTPGPPLHFPTMIGDSHYRSVTDANLHFMNGPRGGFSNQLGFQPSPLTPAPYFNQYQPFNNIPHFNADQQINPTPRVNQNQSSNTQLPFHQNQSIRQPHPNRMQRPSESFHREWEYARPGPPLHCDRFIVLSYNLLADYLAINHWDQLYSHIPNHMLDWNWRKRNIISELGWWSADIMCFQEVDKFHELEDELKTVGYSGIWKMRTGDAVDGCAIFWRASRFKLLYEEAIEFNKLGLRNNVAQICVLESLPRSNSDLPTSSTGSNKVVVCNIHVLFNPRRGEIKLGQVRILLEKAHAVSKIWNDAPIVFCGDFNCTPKSPLYNFFTEQKLDLTCLARDKVSGQEACVIRPFRQFGGYQGVPSAYTSVPPTTGMKGPEFGTNQRDSLSEMQRLNVSDILGKSSSTGNDSTESAATSEQMSKQHCEGTEIGITNEIEPSSFEQSFQCADGSQPDKSSDLKDNMNASEASDRTYIDSDKDTGHNEDVKAFSVSNNGFSSERLESVSNESSVELTLDEKIAKLLIDDPEEDMNGGSKADKEDYNTFLSKLHNNEDDLPSDPVERDDTEKDGSQGDANLDKIPPDKRFVPGDVYRIFYDRSSWTPVEFVTATGNADCTIMEHPLKLKSTYTEVEDLSHTRDVKGEPEVTSYNKCFLGTVDYIWRSEGLQTVRTLSPIPKHAMQWTRGFPTKKWGSDHIALASELAFVKDTTDENTQTPL